MFSTSGYLGVQLPLKHGRDWRGQGFTPMEQEQDKILSSPPRSATSVSFRCR